MMSFNRLVVAVLPVVAFAPFLAASAPSPAHGESLVLDWTPRGSYAGQEFTSLVSPPGNACVVGWTALNNGGLGVSTDCGVQYAQLFLASAYDVTAKDTNTGYVAAGTLGIAKTLDTGGNWFPVNDGLPPSPDARAVVLHVAHPESLFCGLYGGGVFIGGPADVRDSVTQWTPINEGLFDLSVRALARVRGGTYMIAATDGGLYRRTNNVWQMVAPGVTANAIVIDAADSNRVYAATENGVYRSTNQGFSFSPSSTGMPAVAVNDIARRTEGPNVLYAATRGQGVWESVDYGQTWRKFGPDLPGDNDVRAVLCVVNGTVFEGAQVFAGTRANGLFEANYSTPAQPATWGRLKAAYR